MTSEQEDYIYDRFVDLQNDLIEKGYNEIEILRYMKEWIQSSIDVSQEYNYTNVQEYLDLRDTNVQTVK